MSFAICLGTPLYKYSTLYYGHALVGLFLFVVFFIWFNIKDEERINPIKVLISGYFLGYAIATEYPVAVIAFCLGGYILYVLWKKKSLFDLKVYTHLMMGVMIPIAVVLMYNLAVFHHPFKTGYGYEVVPAFLEGQHGGLMGLGWPNLSSLFYMTFHSTMGVFWQSPVLLLVFLGWFRMWQDSRHRAEAVFSFGVVVIYFLMMSGYFIWWGGSAFTPRNLIPVFPFFGIPLAFLAQKWERVLLTTFSLVSIAQMFIVTAANARDIGNILDNISNISISTMFQHSSMIYDIFLPNFVKQDFVANRGQEFFNLRGFQSLLPLLVFEVCMFIAFVKSIWKKHSDIVTN